MERDPFALGGHNGDAELLARVQERFGLWDECDRRVAAANYGDDDEGDALVATECDRTFERQAELDGLIAGTVASTPAGIIAQIQVLRAMDQKFETRLCKVPDDRLHDAIIAGIRNLTVGGAA